jgi:hypothetical protein
MRQIRNQRELSQLICAGASQDELVTISISDMQRMTEAAHMTLRDQFAMTAAGGLYACEYYAEQTAEMCAKFSYELADAMLQERNRV